MGDVLSEVVCLMFMLVFNDDPHSGCVFRGYKNLIVENRKVLHVF